MCSFDARNRGSTRPPLKVRWADWDSARSGRSISPHPREIASELGRMEKERPAALLARRTRTIKLCSFDARSKGQPWPILSRGHRELEGPRSTAALRPTCVPFPERKTSELDLGCASSRDPPLFPFSLRLGWKECGLRRSTWRLPYLSGVVTATHDGIATLRRSFRVMRVKYAAAY